MPLDGANGFELLFRIKKNNYGVNEIDELLFDLTVISLKFADRFVHLWPRFSIATIINTYAAAPKINFSSVSVTWIKAIYI